MNYEIIKTELESEIESLLQMSEYKTQNATGIDKLKASANHMEKGEAFSHAVIDRLNQILHRYKIEFENDDEKEKFMTLIRPIIGDSMRKFILN